MAQDQNLEASGSRVAGFTAPKKAPFFGALVLAVRDGEGWRLKDFDTVEINASFYSWPTVAGVQAWRRQSRDRDFVYTVKVCELITHVKRFKATKTLINDFGLIADILGARMGCFLFQLPPSYRYTRARLNAIVSQLDPARRNVVEFRHASWWNL